MLQMYLFWNNCFCTDHKGSTFVHIPVILNCTTLTAHNDVVEWFYGDLCYIRTNLHLFELLQNI